MFCLPDSYELVDFFVLASSERRRRRSQAEKRRSRWKRPEKRSRGGGGIAVYAAKGSLFSNGDADRRKRKKETSRNLVCEEFAMGETASDNFMFAV